MKRVYIAPELEVERYVLNTAIALGCNTIVTWGPGDPTHPNVCPEFPDIPVDEAVSVMSTAVAFYDDNCECTYSSTGAIYLQS